MDWQMTWHTLQGVVAVGALVLASASIVFFWRLRGIINWKRSLRDELECLKKEAEAVDGARRKALETVLKRCQSIWQTTFPDLKELTELPWYVRSIAACYHPQAERPELRVTAGVLLKCVRESVSRLELILRRPGFQRLRRVRIRHIRQTYEWSHRMNHYWIVGYFYHNWKLIKRIFQLRLVVLPDPLSWLAYLSNRLTILTFVRYLVADIYLLVGRLAIQAYDEQVPESPLPTEMDELEEVLEDLSSLKPCEFDNVDPGIREIRNGLVGLTATIIAAPGLEDWKNAVKRAASVIAKKHFPNAERPLEEAALGPVLKRFRACLKSVCQTERTPVVKRLHSIRIESLFHVRSVTNSLLPKQARTFAGATWDIYRLIKWPLMAYRTAKKTWPPGIALDVGLTVCKRGFTNVIFRYTFDMACRELEMVYNDSRVGKSGLNGNGRHS